MWGPADPGPAVRQALCENRGDPGAELIGRRVRPSCQDKQVALPVNAPLAVGRMAASKERRRPCHNQAQGVAAARPRAGLRGHGQLPSEDGCRHDRGDRVVRNIDELSDAQVHGDARDHVGLLRGQALFLDHPVDDLKQRVARGEHEVFREVLERTDLLAVEIGDIRRYLALRLQRKARCGVELARGQSLELVVAFEMRHLDIRPGPCALA